MYKLKEPSPIQNLTLPELTGTGVKLFVKREDLVYSSAHGNKFRKLKYHLIEAHKNKCRALVTLGGPFSNHIYATAYIGSKLGLDTVGYIRGEFDPENPTLKQARAWGMELHFINRKAYKFYYGDRGIPALKKKHPGAYVIPLGGTHPIAIRGMSELVFEVNKQSNLQFDYWVCPLATGGTAAGLIQGLAGQSQVVGCNVLKGQKLSDIMRIHPGFTNPDVFIFQDAHFGGFGKFSPDLIQFIHRFYKSTQIYLDPVYTGKMMLKLMELLKQDFFPKNKSVLVVHTGGLQGIKAFNYRFGANLPSPIPS